VDSDQDIQEHMRPSRVGALSDIRERFLEDTPRAAPGRFAIAALLMLAGLWIGLFSWLGSYAFELSEKWTSEEPEKPPSLLGKK
jgi:hypothetical protein